MSYDTWKTTNPDNEKLGPESEDDDRDEYHKLAEERYEREMERQLEAQEDRLEDRSDPNAEVEWEKQALTGKQTEWRRTEAKRVMDGKFQYILPVGVYRSQGESHFADWLDRWQIPFAYEPECLTLPSGELYRPDFVLTVSKVMVEIKPAIFKDELFKAYEAAAILPTGWHFWIIEMRGYRPAPLDVYQVSDHNEVGHGAWGVDNGYDGDGWMGCTECKRPFILSAYKYACHHCHVYDGTHCLNPVDIMKPPRNLLDLQA